MNYALLLAFGLILLSGVVSGQEAFAELAYRSEIGSSGSGNGELNRPAGVAYDGKDGLLYVADSHNNRISVFV